jgi:hypothetical protein
MLTTPKAPWFVILAVAIAGVAVWEQTVRRRERTEQLKVALKPPAPAPTLEALEPQKGSVFEQSAPIVHRWTPVPGVEEYLVDFAHPRGAEVCRFDAARPVRGATVTLSHDDKAECTVWRVRTRGGLVAGSSYSVGHAPGCTLPPSAMVACLEGATAADVQAPPDAK